MKRERRGKSDPMERQIEQAFRPGEFIYDRACFSFVSALEQVAAGVKELITAEPARAVALGEAFLAGCHAKAGQLDDSSGNFGMFLKDLICLWIRNGRPVAPPRMRPPPRCSDGWTTITVDTAVATHLQTEIPGSWKLKERIPYALTS
jgi:hypothetical protein